MRLDDWAALWNAQNGQCYLCGEPLGTRWQDVAIEHDHRCCPLRHSCRACRRGLACTGCNVAVGGAQDDPDRLRRIAANLESARHSATDRMRDKPAQDALF